MIIDINETVEAVTGFKYRTNRLHPGLDGQLGRLQDETVVQFGDSARDVATIDVGTDTLYIWACDIPSLITALHKLQCLKEGE